MSIKALRRGNETKVAFMLVHTVVLNQNGRKLPCTREEAIRVFDANKKLRMFSVTQESYQAYIFEDGTDRKYEMFSQRS